jgi:hypothetical protein
VNPVLAADLAELCLDGDAVGVAMIDHAPGGVEIVRVGQPRSVVHDGRESEIDRLMDEIDVVGVIQVDSDRHPGPLGQRDHGETQRPDGAVVANAVLADLHDQCGAG